MEKAAYTQYKSPDTSNVYTVIAVRPVTGGVAEIGVNLESVRGHLEIRFAVISPEDPKLKAFTPRFGTKKFQLVGTEKTAVGQSLNKEVIRVFRSPKAATGDLCNALLKNGGFDHLAEWISNALDVEGFECLYDLKEELPEILMGPGPGDAVEVVYPPPIKQEEKAPEGVKVGKPHVPEDDGEFEEGDNEDDD